MDLRKGVTDLSTKPRIKSVGTEIWVRMPCREAQEGTSRGRWEVSKGETHWRRIWKQAWGLGGGVCLGAGRGASQHSKWEGLWPVQLRAPWRFLPGTQLHPMTLNLPGRSDPVLPGFHGRLCSLCGREETSRGGDGCFWDVDLVEQSSVGEETEEVFRVPYTLWYLIMCKPAL